MRAPVKGQGNKIDPAKTDITASLSDALLRRVLLALPPTSRASCALVCHRWLRVLGGLRRSLRLLDWAFLESGRLPKRFPDLTDIDLTWACMRDASRGNSIIISLSHLELQVHPQVVEPFSLEGNIRSQQLLQEALDRGIAVLASSCPNLQRLRIVDVGNHGHNGSFSEWEFVSSTEKAAGLKLLKVASNDSLLGNREEFPQQPAAGKLGINKTDEGFRMGTADAKTDSKVSALVLDEPRFTGSTPRKGKGDAAGGLVSLAEGCPLLQELEIHQCSDETISAVAKFQNVQILRLVGTVEGLSRCSFTDVGLTILARSCRRLMKLELIGCEASFAGIAAIGQCCLMLEELTLSSTGFEEGWVAALSYYDSLRTLRLESCKYIDRQPGPAELLKRCPTLERLQLACCDLRDRVAFGALLSVCTNVKELEFQNCWGLEDETFALVANCRKVRLLYMDGCSLITAAGLEVVILTFKEMQRLRVVHCNNIRDSEVSENLGNFIYSLKEFSWRPDTKSMLSSIPALNQSGRWFFSKA